jgi:hypothetical protein
MQAIIGKDYRLSGSGQIVMNASNQVVLDDEEILGKKITDLSRSISGELVLTLE